MLETSYPLWLTGAQIQFATTSPRWSHVHSLVWAFTKNLLVDHLWGTRSWPRRWGWWREDPGSVWNPAHNGWWSALWTPLNYTEVCPNWTEMSCSCCQVASCGSLESWKAEELKRARFRASVLASSRLAQKVRWYATVTRYSLGGDAKTNCNKVAWALKKLLWCSKWNNC